MRTTPRLSGLLVLVGLTGASLGCAPQVVGGGGAGTTTTTGDGGATTTPGDGGATTTPTGDGGATTTGTPVPPQGLRLAAGADNTCVVGTAGHVACWGSSETGQLGLGDLTDHATPTWIPALTGVTDLAVADFAMCARRVDDSVWCWGMNFYGELDATTSGCPQAAAPCSMVPVLAAVKGPGTLAPGVHDFCAVGETSGGVQCWGAGPPVDATGYQIRSAAGGYAHTCLLFTPAAGQDPARNVVCFGDDSSGELGQGDAELPGPVLDGPAGGFVEIAAGQGFTCGVGGAGEVLCWGDNVFGELGVGTTDTADFPESCPGEGACSRRPVVVGGLPPVAHIAVHYLQACALTTSGEVYCWGTPSHTSPASAAACYGPTPGCSATPQLVAGVEGATQIAVGYGHACALTGASEITCWGLDTHGQLGRGGGPDWDPTPVAVSIPPEPM